MVTKNTFKGVLETGVSFLKVSIVIMTIVFITARIGISTLENSWRDGSEITGIVMIAFAVLVLIAGIIGLSQKLISDAFLEGFKAAKEDDSVGDGTKMNTSETLSHGFDIIGVILLTIIVASILFWIGRGFENEQPTITSLFMGAGCAVILSVMLGLFSRVIAEGVFFGASSTGVAFVPDSEIVSTLPKPEGADWTESERPDHYNRLVISTVVLFVGFFLPWSTWKWSDGAMYQTSGVDSLLDLEWTIDWLLQFFESVDLWSIDWLIWHLLPYVFVATFASAWYKNSLGDEAGYIRAVTIAARRHVIIFGVYIALLVIELITDHHFYYEDYKIYNYLIFDRIGIWFAGLAGLGLILEFTEISSSSETESSDVRFDGEGT